MILTVAINKGHITATNKNQGVHVDININTCNDSEYRKVVGLNKLRSSSDNDGYSAIMVQAMRCGVSITMLRNLEKVFSLLKSHGIYRCGFHDADSEILRRLSIVITQCGVDAIIKYISNNRDIVPDYILTNSFINACKIELIRDKYNKMNLHPVVLEWAVDTGYTYLNNYSDEQISQFLKMLGRFISNGDHFAQILDLDINKSEQSLANRFLSKITYHLKDDIMGCGLFDFKHFSDLTRYLYYDNIKKKNIQIEKAYTANRKYQWVSSDEKVVVTVPRTANDIEDEAEQQHNCMKSYTKDYANRHTVLAFMRKTDEPDHAWISLEISPVDNHIRQALLKCNRTITDEGEAYVNMYRQYLSTL